VETIWSTETKQQPIAIFSTVNKFETGPPPPTQTPPSQPPPEIRVETDLNVIQLHDLSNVLITYQQQLNGVNAKALLDTGAQKDFINKRFTDKSNKITIKTSNSYVRMANGDKHDASHVAQNINIDIHGFYTTASPTVTALRHFDLILGMPWLTRWNPHINFRTKDASVTLPDGRICTLKADMKVATGETHIVSLTSKDFDKSVKRGVDSFLGWIKPTETTTS
jgi:hypothetical protein